ncbi:uncharacterized protein LOC127103763 [Lathyrus oleraceus]|uniref:uncharacterized protein LOC127103763 n=1 Tax=Pisum sativum TaxID=3888 RepID=UPI0021D35AA3|nr:uncharacterized protein LOC127103763 [Pisum sativum]
MRKTGTEGSSLILEFTDRDLIFSTEDSANKEIASSKVGEVGYGSRLGDGDVGGVWIVSMGVGEVGVITFSKGGKMGCSGGGFGGCSDGGICGYSEGDVCGCSDGGGIGCSGGGVLASSSGYYCEIRARA